MYVKTENSKNAQQEVSLMCATTNEKRKQDDYTYEHRKARMASQIDDRLFKIGLYFCWWPPTFNRPNNYTRAKTTRVS
jgi:hypothetical protein